MKTLLLSSAALLIAATGCQSSDTGYRTSWDQPAESSAVAYGRPASGYQGSNAVAPDESNINSVANANGADVNFPQPAGNTGNQVNATAWQGGSNNATPVAVVATVSPSDELFMMNAWLSNKYEIEAGQVALHKSDSAKIRELANKVINDSTNANNDLARIAQQKNVTLPKELDQQRRQMISRLDVIDKASFDTEFLSQQASANRDAIQTFDDESRNGKDAQAKAYASREMPTLQANLRTAEEPYNTASEK